MSKTLINRKNILKRIISVIVLVVIATVFPAGCSTGNTNKSYDSGITSIATGKEVSSEENTTSVTSTTEDVTEESTQPDQPIEENETTSPAETENVTTAETTQPSTTQAPTTQEPTTQAPTTQAPTTQATQEETTAKYIIDYTEESSSKTDDYKYGVKKITTTTDYYYVYSDGSKEKYNTNSYSYYDTSGYCATDEVLLSESNSKAAANMSYYNDILTLVNQLRAEAGVQPLTLDTTLCQAATMRAIEIDYSDYFSHTRPDGTSCFTVFNTYSINYGNCGENIAAGQQTPQAVVTAWKNSEGHYANMISDNYTKLGVGMSNEGVGGYGIYWVQLFTN